MEFAGPASTFETNETEDSLLFIVRTRQRWIDLIGLAAFSLCFCGIAIKSESAVGFLFGLGILGIGLYHWFDSPVHSLFVTEFQLVSSRAGTIHWHQIYGVTHGYGGEDDPSGLYTQGAIGGDCLLELSEEQTLQVITAIYAKFPYLVLKPQPEPGPVAWLADRIPILGGNTSGLTRLNLSGPKDPKA